MLFSRKNLMELGKPYRQRKNIHRKLCGEYGRYSPQILYVKLYIAILYRVAYKISERFKC